MVGPNQYFIVVNLGNLHLPKFPLQLKLHVPIAFTFYYVLLYFPHVLPMFYSKTFMFCYTFFNIYQLNLTVTNYQIYYPNYQKSYPTVTTVIIPTLLSDYRFPRKISTYVNFPNSKITTYNQSPREI